VNVEAGGCGGKRCSELNNTSGVDRRRRVVVNTEWAAVVVMPVGGERVRLGFMGFLRRGFLIFEELALYGDNFSRGIDAEFFGVKLVERRVVF
jgi:hypothetical protein